MQFDHDSTNLFRQNPIEIIEITFLRHVHSVLPLSLGWLKIVFAKIKYQIQIESVVKIADFNF